MVCGGPLHRGDFPRKGRGFAPGIDAECIAGEPGPDVRLSFCCAREGCRKRHTPASVRFLGRRVYMAIVVVLFMAMAGLGDRGPDPAPALGVSRRTVGRWRSWWGEDFLASDVWRAARARLMPPVDESMVPGSLLPRFGQTPQEQVFGVLRLLLPLSGRVPPDSS